MWLFCISQPLFLQILRPWRRPLPALCFSASLDRPSPLYPLCLCLDLLLSLSLSLSPPALTSLFPLSHRGSEVWLMGSEPGDEDHDQVALVSQ